MRNLYERFKSMLPCSGVAAGAGMFIAHPCIDHLVVAAIMAGLGFLTFRTNRCCKGDHHGNV